MRSTSPRRCRSLVGALSVPLLAALLAPGLATGQAPGEQGRTWLCPVDQQPAQARGSDGKTSPKRYSDLEVPSRAYSNLVVACGRCGYANWTSDFERPIAPSVRDFLRTLKGTAALAAADPAVAYEHHMQILHFRSADLREQIGAGLFYTYVLKRKRPQGGQNHALEGQILEARRRLVSLLQRAIREDPPAVRRERLEWDYLLGELQRLTLAPREALPLLARVCDQREEAGYSVGKLACEMRERAARSETFEDYRDGVFDAVAIPRNRDLGPGGGGKTDKPAAPPSDKPPAPPADKPPAPPADKPAGPPVDKPAGPPAD